MYMFAYSDPPSDEGLSLCLLIIYHITTPVWLDEGGIANIISLKRAKQCFKVEYDSNNNRFIVTHRENGSVCHLHESRKGLYYMDLNQRTEYVLVTTVKDNKEKYNPRDVGKATVA